MIFFYQRYSLNLSSFRQQKYYHHTAPTGRCITHETRILVETVWIRGAVQPNWFFATFPNPLRWIPTWIFFNNLLGSVKWKPNTRHKTLFSQKLVTLLLSIDTATYRQGRFKGHAAPAAAGGRNIEPPPWSSSSRKYILLAKQIVEFPNETVFPYNLKHLSPTIESFDHSLLWISFMFVYYSLLFPGGSL